MIPITTVPQWLTNVIEHSKNAAVAVIFTSPTCGPCKELKPKIEALGRKVFEVDAGVSRDLAVGLGIRSAPTFRIYKDGEVIFQAIGDKPEILDALVEHIAL